MNNLFAVWTLQQLHKVVADQKTLQLALRQKRAHESYPIFFLSTMFFPLFSFISTLTSSPLSFPFDFFFLTPHFPLFLVCLHLLFIPSSSFFSIFISPYFYSHIVSPFISFSSVLSIFIFPSTLTLPTLLLPSLPSFLFFYP